MKKIDLKKMTTEEKEKLYIQLLAENKRLLTSLGKTNGALLDLATENPELIQ